MRRRTVSVMSIAKPTPFDYYQQRIEARYVMNVQLLINLGIYFSFVGRDYETALSCANQFKIRPDAGLFSLQF
jgi:hypothetical protein